MTAAAATSGVPDRLVLNRGAVERLNWQPRVCPPPLACIASRRGDILELIFGGGDGPTSGRISGRRHRYQIEPLTNTTVAAKRIAP